MLNSLALHLWWWPWVFSYTSLLDYILIDKLLSSSLKNCFILFHLFLFNFEIKAVTQEFLHTPTIYTKWYESRHPYFIFPPVTMKTTYLCSCGQAFHWNTGTLAFSRTLSFLLDFPSCITNLFSLLDYLLRHTFYNVSHIKKQKTLFISISYSYFSISLL